ncbi:MULTISPECIES: universal stress protein [unclassified Streptomyces]|uniref:universal stress protein n=1 Tax=unclassified Streptomyces TaxID=2593676 RepID=UPI00278C8527|nr:MULTISPECIES: universal stress protein [unclassified Streptomyces]
MLRAVVVGVDESTESRAAAQWAGREATLRERPLRLVHAWSWSPHLASDVPAGVFEASAAQRERARSTLGAAETRVRAAFPALSVTAEAVEGPASSALIRAGGQAEVLVLGSRGLGVIGGAVAGSVAQHVAAAATVPVVLVRPGTSTEQPRTAPEDVVLGLDLADPCDEVIAFGFTAAALRGAPLRVVSAWRDPAFYTLGPGEVALAEGPQRAAEWQSFQQAVLESWRGKFPGVEVSPAVVEGRAARPLLDAAQGAGLVVVGRRIREAPALGRHNGPVTHAVMHHAACPVAIVPHA